MVRALPEHRSSRPAGLCHPRGCPAQPPPPGSVRTHRARPAAAGPATDRAPAGSTPADAGPGVQECLSHPGPAGPAAWKADPGRAVPNAARSQTLAGPGRAGPGRAQPREALGSAGPGAAAGGVCTAGGTERVSAARRAGITPWWPSRGADEREAAWQGGEEPGRGKGSAAARSGAQRGGRAAAMGR